MRQTAVLWPSKSCLHSPSLIIRPWRSFLRNKRQTNQTSISVPYQPPACHHSSLDAGLCISPCWTSWVSSLPICMSAKSCGASATAPSLLSSANMPQAYSVPSSTSLMKVLNSIVSHVDLWGLWHQLQHSEPGPSFSFLSTSIFTCLPCTLSACLWWYYKRQYQSLSWSQGTQNPSLLSWPIS